MLLPENVEILHKKEENKFATLIFGNTLSVPCATEIMSECIK